MKIFLRRINLYLGLAVGLIITEFSDKSFGQKVRSTFKPIHVASIYGLPSKIIGLIVCMLGTFCQINGINYVD